MTLTFIYMNKCFKWHFYSSSKKQLPKTIFKPMHKCISYSLDKLNLDHIIRPSNVTLTFNLPEQIFQMALLLLKENNYTILFGNPCTNVQVMAKTSPDGLGHNACMHARTYTEVDHKTTLSRSPQAGLTKIVI